MTYILGISAYYHESAACLVCTKTNEIIGYCKEESVSRVKGDNSFPKYAINELLASSSICISEISEITFYERPLSAFIEPIRLSSKYVPQSLSLIVNQFGKAFKGSLAFHADLEEYFPLFSGRIQYLDHHLSHLYSSLASSSKTKDLCAVIVDGFGDTSCTSIFRVNTPRDIRLVWESKLPNSIGLFYSAVTDFLGFSINEGEYKVMGLASYGEPLYLEQMQAMLTFQDDDLALDLKFFEFHKSIKRSYSDQFSTVLGIQPRKVNDKLVLNDPLFFHYANIASSAQKHVEDLLSTLFRLGRDKTGFNSFLFGGGVAMNSVAIPKIVQDINPEYFEVAWSPGDAGSAIGAAYWTLLKHNTDFEDVFLNTPFIGLVNNELDIETLLAGNLENVKIADSYNFLPDLCRLLEQGHTVAVCRDAAEIGPRALGNRSLICNGESDNAVKYMNEVVKGRSPFRPTAPSTNKQYADILYELDPRLLNLYKVMGAAVSVNRSSEAYDFPTTHIDKTARIQIADEGSLVDMIVSFSSSLRVIANTSFNISSDPTITRLLDSVVGISLMNIQYILTDSGLYQFGLSLHHD